MNLERWNPFRELEDMQGRLNRLFGTAGLRSADDETLAFSQWAPAVDVQETDAEYLIKADLPEVKKEDIKVEFHDGVLTLEGERRQDKEEKGKRFHKIERSYGRFVRRFSLPSEVDASKVSAEFKEGVLNIHLPKSPIARPKAIQVKVG